MNDPYSPGANDDCHTPAYGVKPILEFIPPDAIVWCPFDIETSEYVKQISEQNPVVYSHIANGQDYFSYEPDEWDVMVSNPPFTGKRAIFRRALAFGKPFALIMTNTWLNDRAPMQLFKDKDLQLLMFDRRIEFIQGNDRVKYKIPFASSYFCWNLLPKQIIIKELSKITGSLEEYLED